MEWKIVLIYEVDKKGLPEAREKTRHYPFPVLRRLHVKKSNPLCITIRSNGKDRQYKTEDIVYILAIGKRLFFHIKGYKDSILCETQTLKDFEKKHPGLYVRISRGCLVNKAYVLHCDTSRPHRLELSLFNEANLTVNREYYQVFCKEMEKYQEASGNSFLIFGILFHFIILINYILLPMHRF